MSKKTLVAAITVSLILFSLYGMQLSNVAKANPFFYYTQVNPIAGSLPSTIIILNPQNSTTYYSNIVQIGFNVTHPSFPNGTDCGIHYIDCRLDGSALPNYSYRVQAIYPYSYVQDSNLSEGNHTLEISVEDAYFPGSMTIFYLWASSTVSFMVDTTPPSITNLSLENITYTSSNVQLNFTVNKTTSWLGYSLDNQGNVTIAGNTTLAGLSNGSHSLLVYANDTAGNMGKSETVFFTIDTSTPSPSPEITVISPYNTTYSSDTGFILTIYVNQPTSWIGYSIDGHANVTLTGPVRISGATGLIDGYHNITVYANDTAGNMGKSDTVYFTQAASQLPTMPPLIDYTPTSSPSPAMLPLDLPVIVVVLGIAIIGVLAYLTEHYKRWKRS